MKQFITLNQLITLLNTMKNEINFNLTYERVAPKCVDCGAKKAKWWGEGHIEICPKCGGKISYVNNADGKNISGTGIDGHLFRYFDVNANDFRHCRLVNISYITEIDNNDEYFIVKGV